MQSSSISIIICCYNSALRITDTLSCLAALSVPDGIAVDIVLVDNASTDNTKTLAAKVWNALQCDLPFKIADEKEPGLSFARKKGIESSTGAWILFCDDDNHLDHQYIDNALTWMAMEKAGIVGGRGTPVFEKTRPVWWEQAQFWYACGKLQEVSGEIDAVNGAGMLIKREVIQAPLFQLPMFLTDRIGTNLISGGDVEMCRRAALAGYRIFYCDEAFYGHYMPDNRVQISYLKKLLQGISYGFELLKAYDVKRDLPAVYFMKLVYGLMRLYTLGQNTFGLSKGAIAAIRINTFLFYLKHRREISANQQIIRRMR